MSTDEFCDCFVYLGAKALFLLPSITPKRAKKIFKSEKIKTKTNTTQPKDKNELIWTSKQTNLNLLFI